MWSRNKERQKDVTPPGELVGEKNRMDSSGLC